MIFLITMVKQNNPHFLNEANLDFFLEACSICGCQLNWISVCCVYSSHCCTSKT